MPAGTAINRAEIDGAAKKQGVTIGKGDIVILNTGWQVLATEDAEKFLAGEPGLGKEGAEYLAGLGVVAVGADTWALEVLPGEDPSEAFPVHQILLAKNGVYTLENIVVNVHVLILNAQMNIIINFQIFQENKIIQLII